MTTPLTASLRSAHLDSMSTEPLDILVIGGGVTGAGTALDAAARGLRVGMVEAQDWAAGTSSRSSKLVHGGLRYLQMLDFHLVREALRERDLLLSTTAPHLVREASFIYPLRHRVWERAYVGAGIALYDILAAVNRNWRRALPAHRHLSATGVRTLFPSLNPKVAVGGIRYWDATVDDARLVITLVRTAAEHGALLANRSRIESLAKDADGLHVATVRDLETGTAHTVRARHVITATGVWTEQTQDLAGAAGGLTVLASKGIHVVVSKDRLAGETGLILQTATSVLFVIPWNRYWIIGTTDTPYHHDLANPVPSGADIDYVLDQANAVLAEPLTRADVVGTWAGLRPLLQPGTMDGTNSARISREHTVAATAHGLTVIAGGKLTTYRVMAKDAVDFALGADAALHRSITEDVVLHGGTDLNSARERVAVAGETWGWSEALQDHLIHRYGSSVDELLTAITTQPDLAAPLAHAPAYLRAEIHHAVAAEMALHVDDVLALRTRLHYELADHGAAALDEIGQLCASVLGWDHSTTEREIESYRSRLSAEAAAALATNDGEAAAAAAASASVTRIVPGVAARAAQH